MREFIRITTFGAGLTLFSLSAHAYIDPGTGSALIQGLIAVVAAIGVTVKLYWHRIVGFLGLRRERDAQSDSQERADSQEREQDQ